MTAEPQHAVLVIVRQLHPSARRPARGRISHMVSQANINKMAEAPPYSLADVLYGSGVQS